MALRELRFRPPHRFLTEENRPALAKATNGWLALGLYLLALNKQMQLSRVSPLLSQNVDILVEVTKAMTKTPGEALIQAFLYDFREPVVMPHQPAWQPQQQERREEKRGLLDRIASFLTGE